MKKFSFLILFLIKVIVSFGQMVTVLDPTNSFLATKIWDKDSNGFAS